jgi:hypothetical protein
MPSVYRSHGQAIPGRQVFALQEWLARYQANHF